LTRVPDQSYRSTEGLVVKAWDEEFAVAYAPSQARTHLINAAAATVLQAATEEAVTVASLLNLYESGQTTDPGISDASAANEAHLNATLAGLLGAGLLRLTA
jgi:hypothetical protein